jgi:hypothetical protein
MNFYRYEATEYAQLNYDGDFIVNKNIPNVGLNLLIYVLVKETPKGYWIRKQEFNDMINPPKIWVSKTSKKRFVYPTKDAALTNFIKRTTKRANILNHQLVICGLAISIAESKLQNNL